MIITSESNCIQIHVNTLRINKFSKKYNENTLFIITYHILEFNFYDNLL